MRLLIALLALALCGAEASAACGGLFGRHRVRSKTVIRVTTTGCAPAAKAPSVAPAAPPAAKEAPKAPAPKKTATRD